MKYLIPVSLVLALSLLLTDQGLAQKAKPKKKVVSKTAAVEKLPEVDVGLGRSRMSNGAIRKNVFDSLAMQGLSLYGQASDGGKIQGFNFTYAERTVYEDSVGNPLLMTDFLTEYCYGDTLAAGIRNNLFNRTKPGDTAYFDQIRVRLSNGATAKGRPMKFVIEQ